MLAAAAGGFSTATDLADRLVRDGVPFREAHEITGKAVALCVQENKVLADLTDDDCASVDARLATDMVRGLSVEASIAARNHFGGTSPEQVKSQVTTWRQRLE